MHINPVYTFYINGAYTSSGVIDIDFLLYSLLEEHTPDMKARDEMDARRLWLIAERWTRLKT